MRPLDPPDAVWRTRTPGTYLLLLWLDRLVELAIGRLGRHTFPAGWYVYVGSALGGLGPRLRRHARRVKPRHWHVDALREVAALVAVVVRVGTERQECAAAARLARVPGASRPVRGFGASDCRCPGHLVYGGVTDPPDLRLDDTWTVALPPPA